MLVAGGQGGFNYNSPLNSTELYDPGTSTWSNTRDLISARGFLTATLLPNGKVLAAGGVENAGLPDCTDFVTFNSAELFDPATGMWNSAGSLNTSRFGPATLLPDGRVLVAGGDSCEDDNCVALNSAELYDPATDMWTAMTIEGTPSARRFHTAVWTGSRMLVWGGESASGLTTNAGGRYVRLDAFVKN